jgi:dCMP deaminase
MMEAGHCVRTVHAEVNAVAQAARHGICTAGSTCYCTASPCWNCFKTLVNAGILRIVYEEFYRDERSIEVAEELGIEMVHLPKA